MIRDLSRRSDVPELMDADDVDYETFRGCLRDLAKVNVVSLGHRPRWAFWRRSGAGDALRRADRSTSWMWGAATATCCAPWTGGRPVAASRSG